MKIIKFHSKYIFILILLMILLSITSKLKKKTSIKKTVFSFTSKQINLKSLHLERDGHLIAKCPEKTVLIKIVFEKRNQNKKKLDVGFNCRSERTLLSKTETKDKILISNDFEDITPPNIQCSQGYVLLGMELKKIKEKVQFIWHCGLVMKLSEKSKTNESFFLFSKETPVFDNKLQHFDEKKFTEFLIHTNIGVQNESDDAITLIEFGRKSDNRLFYKFISHTIISPPKLKYFYK